MVVKEGNLSAVEKEALQEFVVNLNKSFSEKIVFIALFGSKARGNSDIDSDIDLLIILSHEDRKLRREILRQAARFSLEYDVLLSPRVIGAEIWGKMRGFSLYQNIQKEAQGLSVEGNVLLLQPR